MLDYAAIRALLPHGHPMLLIDRVDVIEPGVRIRATKAITASEPCYAAVPAGSLREDYAYPPSLLLESLGQAAALLWQDSRPAHDENGAVLLFAGVRGFRVHAPVYPGDVLRHEVTLETATAAAAFARGAIRVGRRRVVTVDSLAAVVRSRALLGLPSAGATPAVAHLSAAAPSD